MAGGRENKAGGKLGVPTQHTRTLSGQLLLLVLALDLCNCCVLAMRIKHCLDPPHFSFETLLSLLNCQLARTVYHSPNLAILATLNCQMLTPFLVTTPVCSLAGSITIRTAQALAAAKGRVLFPARVAQRVAKYP